MISLYGASPVIWPVQLAKKTQAVSLNNTTGSYALWTVTGAIFTLGLWGEVTVALSSNHTSAGFRLVEDAGVSNLTSINATLSSAPIGSIIGANGNSVSPISLVLDQARVSSPGTPTYLNLCNTITGQTTSTIEYRYTTTNTPSSGTFDFYLFWTPATSGASVVPA